jgi:hypothetical protein
MLIFELLAFTSFINPWWRRHHHPYGQTLDAFCTCMPFAPIWLLFLAAGWRIIAECCATAAAAVAVAAAVG